MKIIPLTQLKINGIGKITDIVNDNNVQKHLSDLGFVKGKEVLMTNKLSNSCIVKINNGTPIGLVDDIAEGINIKTADIFISKTQKKRFSLFEKILKFMHLKK